MISRRGLFGLAAGGAALAAGVKTPPADLDYAYGVSTARGIVGAGSPATLPGVDYSVGYVSAPFVEQASAATDIGEPALACAPGECAVTYEIFPDASATSAIFKDGVVKYGKSVMKPLRPESG